jgi:light-regulated signal transduction histidine kinase (bacteriophytochrome)
MLRGYYAGAVDMVYKPLAPEVIRAKVAMFVELAKKSAALERANEELERRVEQRTAELRRSNEDLEQFAYVSSHDLQEPLRMISSYSQLLERRYRGRLDQDADEFLHYIVDGAQRMSVLIQDLLAYSRAGSPATAHSRTETSAAVEAALANLEGSVRSSGAEVVCEALPAVRGNRMELAQLFQNLIGNAIKYRREEPLRVGVSAERRGGAWVFRVRDNGIGIEAQHRDRIFQPFQRLHVKPEVPGSGIGLAICKKIVERHGGRISVESMPGEGAAFQFTLLERSK